MNQRRKKRMQYIDRYLSKYIPIQLWTFIILMVLVAVMYILNPKVYTFEVVGADQEQILEQAQGLNFTMYENATEGGAIELRQITKKENEDIQKKYNRKSILAFVCIIGMMISQKEKRKKYKKIYEEIKVKIK